MQTLIKKLLKGNFFLSIAILITLSIAYLSLIKLSNTALSVNVSDKIQHGIAYFILTSSWLFAFYLENNNKKYVIALLCVVYGIVIEVLQSKLTTYRTGDSLDVVANTFGVLLGFIFFNLIFKKINQINSKDLYKK